MIDDPKKRQSEKHDLLYLEMAFIVSLRSKDPSTQVGAILVSPDTRSISYGYNGFPPQIPDAPEVLSRQADFDIGNPYGNIFVSEGRGLGKHSIILHAEENAIANCHTRPVGWTLYCTHHPCVSCARQILANGIARVVCFEARGHSDLGYEKAAALFTMGGMDFKSYRKGDK